MSPSKSFGNVLIALKTSFLLNFFVLFLPLRFLDKTKNEWDKRANFQKVTGKYDLLHLDYKAKDAVRLFGGKEQREAALENRRIFCS